MDIESEIFLSIIEENSPNEEVDLFLRFHGEVTRSGEIYLVAESAQLTHHFLGVIWESYYY